MAVIVTTYQTRGDRHEVKGQNTWATNSSRIYVPDEMDIQEQVPGNLQIIFTLAVLDECHFIKTLKAKTGVTTGWLRAGPHSTY